MKFKDDLKADIEIFTELDEFAELKILDGVIMPCQVTHYTADKSSRQSENFDGLHGDFTTIYFKAEIYIKKRERLPRRGEQCIFDGKRYDVDSCRNELGVAKLVLSAYRQNVLRGRYANTNY